ncbi:MAG: hypothetical protein WBA23_18715 [Tunicatimonas sp.]|uniref:hypothetical protein n=1 Tax=Tunicatimonas sp. TaxID=1940096 RepID=UPI003C731C1E
MVILSSSLRSEAATQNYRLILTESPSTSALIGWELIGGCPDLQRVYYDTVDHQQDTAAYAFRATITAANFHRGMENYFCHLKNLLPNTKYYLVIGEDQGISPRLIIQTFAPDNRDWQSYWVSPKAFQNSHKWKHIAHQVNDLLPNFVLIDGLANLATEEAWRDWLHSWRPTTYENALVPIVIAGTISADIQYLFNLPSSELRYYPITEKTGLLLSDEDTKIRKRFWKAIADTTQVVWYTSSSTYQIPEKVDLAITTNAQSVTQSPNVFNFPQQQGMVIVSRQQEKLQIQLPDETVLLEMFFERMTEELKEGRNE